MTLHLHRSVAAGLAALLLQVAPTLADDCYRDPRTGHCIGPGNPRTTPQITPTPAPADPKIRPGNPAARHAYDQAVVALSRGDMEAFRTGMNQAIALTSNPQEKAQLQQGMAIAHAHLGPAGSGSGGGGGAGGGGAGAGGAGGGTTAGGTGSGATAGGQGSGQAGAAMAGNPNRPRSMQELLDDQAAQLQRERTRAAEQRRRDEEWTNRSFQDPIARSGQAGVALAGPGRPPLAFGTIEICRPELRHGVLGVRTCFILREEGEDCIAEPVDASDRTLERIPLQRCDADVLRERDSRTAELRRIREARRALPNDGRADLEASATFRRGLDDDPRQLVARIGQYRRPLAPTIAAAPTPGAGSPGASLPSVSAGEVLDGVGEVLGVGLGIAGFVGGLLLGSSGSSAPSGFSVPRRAPGYSGPQGIGPNRSGISGRF